MENLEKLLKLQILEERKLNLQKQLKTFPQVKRLKLLKEEIEAGQLVLRKLNEKLLEAKKRLKKVELDIAVFTEKYNKATSELYSGEITVTKELEAAEKNIAAINIKVKEGEEEALQEIDGIETVDHEARQLLAELEQRKTEFRSLNKAYSEQKMTGSQELEKVEKEIEKLSAKIDSELLGKYYKTCQRFDDRKGIAILRDSICSGCHMGVSFDLIKKAKNKSLEISCDNCGRLLIIE